MFRKLMLTAVAGVGLGAPLTMTSEAKASDIRVEFRGGRIGIGYDRHGGRYRDRDYHRAHYHVLYRRCSHEPWREYGAYRCHEIAHEVEEMLEDRGYEARVVHH